MNKTAKIIVKTLEVGVVIGLYLMTLIILAGPREKSLAADPIFKTSFIPVITEQMEPTFTSNDLLVTKAVEPDYRFQVGNIVSYWDDIDGFRKINTTKIVAIDANGIIFGQGDNKNITPEKKRLIRSDIVAVHKSTLPMIGGVVKFLQNPTVFFIVIILPLLLLFLYNFYGFMGVLKEGKKTDKKDDTDNSEKQAKLDAYIEQLQARQNQEQE